MRSVLRIFTINVIIITGGHSITSLEMNHILTTLTVLQCYLIRVSTESDTMRNRPYEKHIRYDTFLDNPDTKITWIKDITLHNCYVECEKRKHCASLSFHKGFPICLLHKGSSSKPSRRDGFLHTRKEDWAVSFKYLFISFISFLSSNLRYTDYI